LSYCFQYVDVFSTHWPLVSNGVASAYAPGCSGVDKLTETPTAMVASATPSESHIAQSIPTRAIKTLRVS
jgi:hypothetical protein